MVDIWPFHGTRPYNQDAKNLIAPSTDHLSIENIEIFRKNNYWNYLKVLNPVGQLKEKDSLSEAREHFIEMKDFDSDLVLQFTGPVYISLDLDGLDPAYAPGVSHPEPGGLSTRNIINIIHSLKGQVIGGDIVEYNPDKDINDITATTGAKLMKELIGKIMKS